MAAAWMVSDISQVTTELVDKLQATIDNSPLWDTHVPAGPLAKFTVSVSASMPETVRKGDGCQLSLYLLHVNPDKFNRNTYPTGGAAQPNVRQPLALELYYLMTAYDNQNAAHEQQAMSMAMQWLYTNTISKLDSAADAQHYTITMEAQTADELSRLWQALSTPLRLSAVYKVSVLFVAPTEDVPKANAPPTHVGLSVSPFDAAASPPRLLGTALKVNYTVPSGAVSADAVTQTIVNAVAIPGNELIVTGLGLDAKSAAQVFLTLPDGTELDITGWRQITTPAQTLQYQARLKFPSAVGNTKTTSPSPGICTLSVGADGPPKVRSNQVPISVAPRIDVTAVPPSLTPSGGLYTIQGAGFTSKLTELYLSALPLKWSTSAPSAGEFRVDSSETSISFQTPAGLPTGRYYLGVRVNQIDAPPSWFIDIP